MRPLICRSSIVAVVFVFAGAVHAQTPPGAGQQAQPPTQATPGAPQAPPRDTKVPKAATAVIKGRVVAADTGAPLRRARVVLGNDTKMVAANTDAQGRYEFKEVAAGKYALTASKGSYVSLTYGQRRAFEYGKSVEVTDGATLQNLDFALPRGGVITGTVMDEYGEPAAGVRVTAMRSRYEQGRRKLLPVGRAAETNDLGQYRIYGLQPGTYYVSSQPLTGPLAALMLADRADQLAAATAEDKTPYPPSYYPGTLNAAEAQRITVRIGQERSGTDFVQLPGRMARIDGVVTDGQGRAQTPTAVMLMNPANVASMAMATVKPDGTFTFASVAPGEYMVATSLVDANGAQQMAMIPVTVVGGDVENVTVTVSSGARVVGRVVMEDGTAPPFPVSGVKLNPQRVESDVPVRMNTATATGLGSLKDDWTFDWPGLGGSFLLRTNGLPSGYTLKAVLLDGRDITDTPLDIKGTDDVTGLQVVIGSSITEISGRPTDAKGQPAADYSVIVFADEAARWKYPSRFVASQRANQNGGFKFQDLPPGRYLAVALDYVEEGQFQDPEYLESLRPLATTFTLSAGEKKTLALKVTKPEGGL